MNIPKDLRDGLRTTLWVKAEKIRWQGLTSAQKSALYEAWSRDPEYGGRLAHYMDQRRIRTYLKDTIMKGYMRNRQSDPVRPLKALRLDPSTSTVDTYEKPHGRCLSDGRVVSWGNASDWKLILMAVHERAFYVKNGTPYAAVLLSANGKFAEPTVREMVEAGAEKLGIQRLVWLN